MSVPLSRLLGREEPTSSSVSWSATRTDRQLRQTATLSGSVPEHKYVTAWEETGVMVVLMKGRVPP